jgi:L-seryl-tRNA(Ser) seleniumtransferase
MTHARPPSIDAVLRSPTGAAAVARYGRMASVAAARLAAEAVRAGRLDAAAETVAAAVLAELERDARPSLRPVINLTGTVLHTNLGRAVLAPEAIAAAVAAMRGPATLEYDVASGQRGERDDHVRGLLCELTGAEDALAVNNNAAAVLLALAALAAGRETVVSRGELIEIGGSFRMPDIMEAAGTRLVEVGTTNRTHARDYEAAIGPATALVLKVHTSNYRIEGFTAEVAPRDLAALAHARGVPVLDDLGSGTLVDLARHGLPRERTVADAIGDGADLVTFSGDKLLGGPQAGFIVGRRELVRACAKHPLKRALRLDKIRLAALEATLKLYRDPDRLTDVLPTLHLLTRDAADLRAMAERLQPAFAAWAGPAWRVDVIDCRSQIGSGALPVETLPSAGLALVPTARTSGAAPDELARRLRGLAVPVIGTVRDGAVRLDMRCLADEAALAALLA